MANNILIVDDSAVVRMATKRIIERSDVEFGQIFEAENGQAALDILQQQRIDLVLVDLHMPEMNGVELVHIMRQQDATKSIPVVVVSAESSPARIEELEAEGIQGYLHKPFSPEEFRQVILSTWGATIND